MGTENPAQAGFEGRCRAGLFFDDSNPTMKKYRLFLLAMMLSGCMAPVIFDLEHDKVIIQSELTGTVNDTITDKARKGCALHGRRAIYVSTSIDGYSGYYRHLFACVE